MAAKIKTGDEVIVLTGKDKGKTGKVESVLPAKGKALVAGINQVKKHEKPSATSAGGIITKSLPIQLSNVALVDPKSGKATRVGFKIVDGKKVRFAKKSGEVLN